MRYLPFLLLIILLFPLWGLGGRCQAQAPDTLITVTKLPYPEARIFPHERSELPRLSRLPSPGERGRGRGFSNAPPSGAKELEECIQTRHTRLREADLTTLKESKKGAWLKYLPSVSAGLAPAIRRQADGSFNSGLSPTLSIGINSSLIYQAHQDKQQRKATSEAITKRSQLQEDLEIAKLHRLQRRLQIETDKLSLHDGVTDIDRQLFTLYQKQYDNHDIPPEEYLLKRKAFLLQELRTQDQLTRIQTLQYEIEDLAGCITSPISPPALPSRK
jgi:hypothetical protein